MSTKLNILGDKKDIRFDKSWVFGDPYMKTSLFKKRRRSVCLLDNFDELNKTEYGSNSKSGRKKLRRTSQSPSLSPKFFSASPPTPSTKSSRHSSTSLTLWDLDGNNWSNSRYGSTDDKSNKTKHQGYREEKICNKNLNKHDQKLKLDKKENLQPIQEISKLDVDEYYGYEHSDHDSISVETEIYVESEEKLDELESPESMSTYSPDPKLSRRYLRKQYELSPRISPVAGVKLSFSPYLRPTSKDITKRTVAKNGLKRMSRSRKRHTCK